MRFEIPIIIEIIKSNGARYYQARPLFFDHPTASDRDLEASMESMRRKLQKSLPQIAANGDMETIAKWTYSPDATLSNEKLTFDLPGGIFVNGVFTFVFFDALERLLAISPDLPGLCFDIPDRTALATTAEACVRKYFRQMQKETGPNEAKLFADKFKKGNTRWLSSVTVNVNALPRIPSGFASLSRDWRTDLIHAGIDELEKVGRCLDRLYPNQLRKATYREDHVKRLYDILIQKERRAILLLGPDMVGKTSIIEETVRRMVETIERPDRSPPHYKQVWHVNPGRLIAGMSMSGEWERRFSAILEHAQRSDVTLVFDQLLSLIETGKSSHGTLSAGDLLRHHLRAESVRVVAEATPEQFRLLRERERGLADRFEVVRVESPSEKDSLRMLLSLQRELEWTRQCRFEPDLLPNLLELTENHESELAMPGRAANRLRAIASRYAGSAKRIGRQELLTTYREQTGLELEFFDPNSRIERKTLEKSLRKRIIGQDRAVEAMTDSVLLAKSMLTVPKRPLASLFFMGPTGVGKTECAKQLAISLFGDPERLIRFDANEINTASAVARLTGLRSGEEGLLTGAVRRKPFCVLLFDEIEKAHPDLFDLLLQVLDEARLTDSMGRVASFAHAMIVFTSNLGTEKAALPVGFGADDVSRRDSIYLRAVKDFFRPEFVNRVDRFVPFELLNDSELNQIADRLIHEVTTRDGFRRRRCALNITEQAKKHLVSQGRDARFGARSVRRVIEQELAAPLGEFLASVHHENPSIATVDANEKGLHIQGEELRDAEPFLDVRRPSSSARVSEIVQAAGNALRRIEQRIAPHRFQGVIDADFLRDIPLDQYVYLALNEAIRSARQILSEIVELSEGPDPDSYRSTMQPSQIRGKLTEHHSWTGGGFSRVLRAISNADDLQLYFKEIFQKGPVQDALSQNLERLYDVMAELEFFASLDTWELESSALVSDSPIQSYKRSPLRDALDTISSFRFCSSLNPAIINSYSESVDLVPSQATLVVGVGLRRLCERVMGSRLHIHEITGKFHVHDIRLLKYDLPGAHDNFLRCPDFSNVERHADNTKWMRTVKSHLSQEKSSRAPIVRISRQNGEWFDLRLGQLWSPKRGIAALLPLPAELTAVEE
jgi:ATP-dependent Clp protease ATP-binding subunit ClpC